MTGNRRMEGNKPGVTHHSNLLGLMATGTVQLGFIDGVEIDRYGNLNTSTIGDWRRPTVRLPGSGGGVDMAIVRD